MLAKEWWQAQRPGWSDGHAQRVWSRVADDLLPELGDRGMRQITGPELLNVLRRIERRGAVDSAKRIRQYAGAIFTFAMSSGKADTNPAYGLSKAMTRSPRVQHQPALPLSRIPEFFRALHASQSAEVTRLALMLTAHTAVRRTEMNEAVWSEIGKTEWRIPAARMKMNRDHIVPLSRQSRAILKRLRELHPETKHGAAGNKVANLATLSFAEDQAEKTGTSARVAHLTPNAMLSVIGKLGFKGHHTVHGFRTWFSTAAYDSGLWSSEAIEMQLAHVEGNTVKAAYNRALKLDERTRLMVWWSGKLDAWEAEGKILT